MSAQAVINRTPSRMHLPSLAVALLIMLAGTLYPLLMTNAAGHADHALALALFWAMSAGFVRGVGFVPRIAVWRWLFSGWACAAALGLAAFLKFLH
ncbi:MAG: cyd operon YbgE family protein [Burkholderiaceae bacterium]